ncbi:MAG TPA: hypothetical protein VJO32_12495, partial [Ktedonobacteraceae bacterium]|nr:hypothetical protein [Ktedonobacteraceae bacterium]
MDIANQNRSVDVIPRFACHPERSEGSLVGRTQILRCAQDDRAAGSKKSSCDMINGGRMRLGEKTMSALIFDSKP